ncbi:hypothetical protein QQP08_020046, partial [Theobroma cacao]
MIGTKRWVLFKRLIKKESWRWKFLGSAFKWKRLNIQLSFVDDVLFRIAILSSDLGFERERTAWWFSWRRNCFSPL